MSEKITEEGTKIEVSKDMFTLGDPLAKAIIRSGWSPAQVGIIFYLYAITTSLIIALIGGTLVTRQGGNFIGLFNDVLCWPTETLLIPAIWIYFTWVLSAPAGALKKISDSKVHALTSEDKEAVERNYNRKYLNLVALLLAIGISILYYLQSTSCPLPYFGMPFLRLC